MTTNKAQMSPLENYLNQMWHDYCHMNPEAVAIYNLFTQSGETVQNDHIALRTFNHPKLGIKSLAQHFIKYGYHEAGEYFFTEKKLYAKHYENANPEMPKIFISELELEKMSSFVQETLNHVASQITPETQQNEKFVYGGKTWDIEHKIYEKLATESEYASWVYAYGFRPNHFTVSINHLKKLTDITKLNEFIKSNGYKLNAAGGEIKGTPQELLEQSSTMAGSTSVQFKEGTFSIPACYYEFAKRYQMPNGQYYQGFIAKSADKIFESTNKQ
jgi:hypothetical protein